SAVDCFEFRYVEANGTTGFYLDRVDWAGASGGGEKAAPRIERPERPEPPVVEEPVARPREPRVAPREESRVVRVGGGARAPGPAGGGGRSGGRAGEPPDEEVYEGPRAELRDEPLEEPRVAPREEPRVIPLVPVEEPRMVILHETTPSPRPEP